MFICIKDSKHMNILQQKLLGIVTHTILSFLKKKKSVVFFQVFQAWLRIRFGLEPFFNQLTEK